MARIPLARTTRNGRMSQIAPPLPPDLQAMKEWRASRLKMRSRHHGRDANDGENAADAYVGADSQHATYAIMGMIIGFHTTFVRFVYDFALIFVRFLHDVV